MSMRVSLAVVASIVAALAVGAVASSAPAPCSARGLKLELPEQKLPAAVLDMRRRIFAAALNCDFGKLALLGNRNGKGLQFSYGAARSAREYWARLERTKAEPVLRSLAIVLTLPVTRFGGSYAWPSAHQLNPKPSDWQAVRALYTQKQIDAMRKGGIGYIGYRVGIKPNGDWIYFVAGD
jgi:hypothetical protein